MKRTSALDAAEFASAPGDGLRAVARAGRSGKLSGPFSEYLVAIEITPGALALERDRVSDHLIDIGTHGRSDAQRPVVA